MEHEAGPEQPKADDESASKPPMAQATTTPSPEPVTPPPPPPPPPPRSVSQPEPQRFPIRLAIFVSLLLAIAIGAGIHGMKRPDTVVTARAIGARLDLAAGEVIVDEKGVKTKALSGAPLAIGSRITTGKGARALVRTGDGASVFLRGETEIVLETRGISLEKGEAWLDAPRVEGEAIAFTIGKHRLSAADAGLSIRREGESITVYVARGLAILTSPGGRIEIGAGEQGVAQPDGAPKLAAVAFWQDWTGGMGDSRPAHGGVGSASGRIYGMDPMAPPGTPARKLGIAKQAVRAVIRDGLAETEVDQTFSNPGGQSIEGWYWFTVPPDAAVTSFALETNGQLVEGEVVEKKEAAAKYAAAVAQAVDPALLEWVDGRTYRARIFPIPASGTRRVVLRYIELLPTVEGKTRYVYPLRSPDPVRFDEFSLSADLGAPSAERAVATSLDATIDKQGRLVSMRRSGYVPRADFQIEIGGVKPKSPVRAWRFEAGANQADYLMMRYVPDLDFAKLPAAKGEVVVVVDTSAGGDESARALRTAAAEGVLRALADDDRFALVALDVTAKVVYPQAGLAPATEGDIAKALEKLSDHAIGGATDMGAMFEPALERLHGTEQPAIVYVGDGAATSGETTGEGLLERLRRSMSGSRARFFTIGAGPDARHELLAQLARAGGGQHLRIDEADQTTGQALRLASAIKTPTITDLEVDLGAGLDQPFYSATGKLARGEELMLLARTHHALPEKVRVKGRAGGQPFEVAYPLELDKGVITGLAPRLWAAEYMRRLLGSGAGTDENRAKILELGLEYGLMTPYTSILALDSDAAYAQQNIKRRHSKLRGVRLTAIENDKHEAALGCLFSPMALAPIGGCSKSDFAPASEEAEQKPSDEKSGGTGTKHKGAEGSMGSPASGGDSPAAPPPPVAATPTAIAAPAAEPDPAPSSKDIDEIVDVAKKKVASSAPKQLKGDGDDEKENLDGNPLGGSGVVGKIAGKPLGGQPPTGPAGKKEDKTIATKPAVPKYVPKPPPFSLPAKPLSRCSDAANRPLAERMVLWQKRLKQAKQAYELTNQYELAASSCELPDFRDQSALLGLIQQKVTTEQAAETVLAHFRGRPELQTFLARAILRRTVDVHVAAAVSRVLFGGVDWMKVDRELLDKPKVEDKLAYLRATMLIAPGDPMGDVRLVKLLAQKGDRQEALAYGRRLRDRGFMTPTLAQQLGDVLADAGEQEEALRTYSEVVEFDGDNPASRRVLGDIFLRQGWYAAAYRQYKTLTDLDPKSPASWLRLANAAAGAGRVDEALRLEREVSNGEGSPGPNDPRYFARLWSATRLGLLLSDPAKAGATPDAIGRKLKELQLFSGPGTLALVTWDDLDARLSLVAEIEKDQTKQETLLGESTDAGTTGLFGLLASTEAWEKRTWTVRPKTDAPGARAVKFRVVLLTWDGKAFSVKVKKGELGADGKPATF